jgi:hypothetical protein
MFVFKLLPESLLKHFFHMQVMGPFPIDLRAGAAPEKSLMGMIDVVRNTFSDILSFLSAFQLTVTAGATSPGSLALAKQVLHLSKLIVNMIGGYEYACACCFSPRNTGVPRNDRPLLFLSMSDELTVVHVPVIKNIMTQQPQPCCKPSQHYINDKFHRSVPGSRLHSTDNRSCIIIIAYHHLP